MNTNNIKKYSPKARREFIEAVTKRLNYLGIRADNKRQLRVSDAQIAGDVMQVDGNSFSVRLEQPRRKLVERAQQQGFEQLAEQTAYTWFNRLCAIRYMELHGYLEHSYRVLSHPEDKNTPEILEHAEHVDLPGLDKTTVIDLKLDGTKEDELYRMLLIAQCNALHQAMPFLFEKISDETELLLPANMLHTDSLIRQLVEQVDEALWQDIEIIGWLYQFYISEKKDQVIGKVVRSEDIPAADRKSVV